MGSIITERVKGATLTKAQRKIAKYFIHNPERVGMSSSMEVARAIGVSDASITRFARAIGYEGFTDLKADIYNSLVNQATGGVNSLSLADRFDANRARFGADTSRTEYMKLVQYDLERTFQQNTDETFLQAVHLLKTAAHRYVVGFRGCLGAAGQFAWLMRFLLPHVIHICDEGPGGVGLLQDIAPGDCAVFFSLSRYYKVDLRLAQLAKERGAAVILVTNSVLCPLSDLADILLLAETKHASFFNSAVPLSFMAEYLVSRLAEEVPDIYRQLASERDDLTAELRL